MQRRKMQKIVVQSRISYGIIFLLILFLPGHSQTTKKMQPSIGISPLWVIGEYGLYWGVSITGWVEFAKYHKIALSADLAPLGLLGMTDVDTEGKEQHWGGTLSYLFKIVIVNNLIRVEPGATIGLSSIPYIYGTFREPNIGSNDSTPNKRPARETIWGLGPELRISIGRNNVQFFVAGRSLFAENHNTSLLTNIGISILL